MPTVLRVGPYRFFFFSNERNESPHIHVRRGRAHAKFWLQPILLARTKRFAPQELNELRRHIESNEDDLLEAWHEHFGS